MYQEATQCPFPIYADPTKSLYQHLGMTRTLAMGPRPGYMKKGVLSSAVLSIMQGLKEVTTGRVLQAGDYQQVGGEYLFEPTAWSAEDRKGMNPVMDSPLTTPISEEGERKSVTWCHRMRNTRDHAEIPELREVLGLESEGAAPRGGSQKRWSKAIGARKGTGLSAMSRTSEDAEGEKKLMPSTAAKVPEALAEV
jgi:hypothetical protein